MSAPASAASRVHRRLDGAVRATLASASQPDEDEGATVTADGSVDPPGSQAGAPPTGGDPPAEPRLPLDQRFELLKNRRRREVLHYLWTTEAETTLGTLAEHIAAIENDTTVKQITSSQRKRVYVGLYQCHLPKMDDMDVLEFDQNRGTVALGPNADLLRPYLDTPDASPDWPRRYLGVVGAGMALALAGVVAPVGYALAVTGAFLLVAVGTGCCALWQYSRA